VLAAQIENLPYFYFRSRRAHIRRNHLHCGIILPSLKLVNVSFVTWRYYCCYILWR